MVDFGLTFLVFMVWAIVALYANIRVQFATPLFEWFTFSIVLVGMSAAGVVAFGMLGAL